MSKKPKNTLLPTHAGWGRTGPHFWVVFLATRAAQIGYRVFGKGSTLNQKPHVQDWSQILATRPA